MTATRAAPSGADQTGPAPSDPAPSGGAPTGAVVIALTRRALHERRRFVLGLSLATAAFAIMVAALYPSLGASYDELLDDLPPALEGMFGNADFSTAEGFVQVELFSFLCPALAIAAGCSIGAGALAGAEQAGRLSLILANAVRRSQVVSAAIAASIMAIVGVSLSLFAGIAAGRLVADFEISMRNVGAATVSLGLLAIAVAMITVAAGAATGKRSVALGAATTVAVASYAIDAFFPLSTALEPFAPLSLWYPYAHNQPMVNGLEPVHVGVLLTIAFVAAAVAYWSFEHRDLT